MSALRFGDLGGKAAAKKQAASDREHRRRVQAAERELRRMNPVAIAERCNFGYSLGTPCGLWPWEHPATSWMCNPLSLYHQRLRHYGREALDEAARRVFGGEQ